MSDQGKTAAIEELRREVGFGCPVPGCRSPFLTWHHFDPPWNVENHWRPEGIIAMCPLCHADADEKRGRPGAYSKEELRAMKTSNCSVDDVAGGFRAWQDKESLLVRVGGCYTDTSAPVILINDVPQISVSKNEAGLLSLSFELRNQNDDVLVKMEDNWFTAYPPNVHDMIVEPKTKLVKVWLGPEDIGLEFSFRRISMIDLDEILSRDRERAAEQCKETLAQMLPEHSDFFEQVRGASSIAKDLVGGGVKGWAKEHCAMADGLIPFLDFEQMAIHFHGQRFTIKDGVAGSIYYSAAFGNGKGAINLRVP